MGLMHFKKRTIKNTFEICSTAETNLWAEAIKCHNTQIVDETN